MKIFFTLFFGFLSIFILHAQGPSDLWIHTYGGTNSEGGNSIISTSDGGSIFVGSTNSSNGNVIGLHNMFEYSDFWVVKLNSSGTIEWQKCLGGSKNEVGLKIIQVSDGGYVIAGSSLSNDGDVTFHYGSDSFTDVWIVKIDSLGNLLWQKTYGAYSQEFACSIDETSDGGLIVAAILQYDGNGIVPVTYNQSMDYWVLKLNGNGEMQWNNHYGGENGDRAYSIKSTPDGGCIVAGQSGSHYLDVTTSLGPFNTDIPDYWILKLSATGVIQWQKSYGGFQADWATSINLTNDGGYIVAGNTYSNNTGNVTNFNGGTDGWVIKLDSLGNIQWQKTLGGSSYNDFINSVKQTLNGGYILCGKTDSTDGDLTGIFSGEKAWIIKLNSSGSISWQKHYINGLYNEFNDITQNADGTYTAVGYRYQNNSDVFAVKLNAESLSNNDFNENRVVFYPNPVDDFLYIQSEEEISEEINVYNILGEKINSILLENNKINLQFLQKGVYFIEMKNEKNQSIRKKIIKK